MKPFFGVAAVILTGGLWFFAGAEPSPTLAITHVTVIGMTAPSQADQTVVIGRGQVLTVGPSSEVKLSPDARVVDAAGKFLIPGLWDMHVHLAGVAADPKWSRDALLPLLTAYGITGVRDMGGDLSALLAWRSAIREGRLLGPQIVAAGPMLVGRGKKSAEQYPIGNEQDARAAVRELKQQGADFIKIISASREAFFAAADEAKRQGLPLVGHVPFSVSAVEASDAGMKSIEHIVYSNLAFDCSSREQELRKSVREGREKGDQTAYAKAMLEAISSYSPEKAASVFARLKRNGTWVVPTLESIAEQAPEHITPESRANDPRLEFVPAALRKEWNPLSRDNQLSEEDRNWWARVFAFDARLTREMHSRGVAILAGSDSLDRFVFPGSSLHQELQFLVEQGFTPLEALAAATRDAARFLGRGDHAGTVAAGAPGDLVLLDGNPLENIANTTRIRGVVESGAYLDRAALDALLSQARAAAAKASVVN
jgi:imidazolonepropionase-like amidohydrolase